MNADRFRWPVRVYYEDTDAGGVVYHANYLRFFERARTEWLRALGLEQDALRRGEGILFAVKSLSMDFLKPARFNELLWVDSQVAELKRASLVFDQVLTRQADEQDVLCKVRVKVVSLNADSFTVAAIPDTLLQRIKDEF
jgi:acyl-CoA thioester hydrolase